MDFLLEIDDQPPDELFMAAVHDYEQSQTNAAENAHPVSVQHSNQLRLAPSIP